MNEARKNEVGSTELLADRQFVARQILRARDALAQDDIAKAYHELYTIADWEFTSTTPWAGLEALANKDITPHGVDGLVGKTKED